MPRRPRRPAALVLVGACSLALLTGCSLGEDAFNTNIPDDQADPAQQQVVRTPGPVPSDLPYATPPLVEPLPGPTGGVPRDTPESVAAEPPGQGAEDLDQQADPDQQ